MSVAVRRKRISKKNKAAWRKTDINDVEKFLEQQRQEERIGSFEEKPDKDLFRIDVDPKEKRTGLTPKQRRKLNALKPMRSLDALINRSKVQDPIVKRNHVIQKKNGRNIEEEIRNPTRPRHFKANEDRAHYYEELEKRKKKPLDDPSKTAKDIWVEEDFRDKIPGLKDEKGWVSKELAVHVANNIGHKVVKVHDSIRHRTTKAKNFEVPHAGTSYNPSFKDHKKLLDEVVEKEEGIIKEEKHLKRVTTDMFSKVTPAERDQQRLVEMSAGLEEEAKEETEKENIKTKKGKTKVKEEANDNISLNPPVVNKKKSRQQRNKQLQQKELQRRHLEKKALKKQIADINRIKSLKAEVKAEEEELNELKKRRKKAELKRKFEPKRLSKTKFVAPDTDVN